MTIFEVFPKKLIFSKYYCTWFKILSFYIIYGYVMLMSYDLWIAFF